MPRSTKAAATILFVAVLWLSAAPAFAQGSGGAQVKGGRLTRGPAPEAEVLGSLESRSQPGALLPFTGAQLTLLALGGIGLMTTGMVILRRQA